MAWPIDCQHGKTFKEDCAECELLWNRSALDSSIRDVEKYSKLLGLPSPFAAAPAQPQAVCPYIVTSRGGTSHCRLAESAQPQAGVPGWQPIETAPKGRKLILGYANKLGNWRTITGRYYLPRTLDCENPDFADEDGYAPEGWYEESEASENILPTDEPPTHWQPLPQPPREIAAAQARRETK